MSHMANIEKKLIAKFTFSHRSSYIWYICNVMFKSVLYPKILIKKDNLSTG